MTLKHRSCLTALAFLLLFLSVGPHIGRVLAEESLQNRWAETEITVNPFGGITVVDSLNIRNMGNASISSVTVLLPKDSKDVKVYDYLGPIKSSVEARNESTGVTATFRYMLRGVEDGISHHDAYTFSVQYSLSYSSLVSELSSGKLRLKTTLSTGLQLPVERWQVKVILPEGAKYENSEPKGVIKVEGLTTVVSINQTNVSASQAFALSVDYDFSPVWSAFRPTLWVGSVVAVVGAVILVRRRRRVEVPEGGRDLELIRAFTEAVEEELSLWDEMDELERDLDDRRLGRKDYNRRRAILDQRVRTLTSSLTSLKQKVRQAGSGYVEYVVRLEAAEGEFALLRGDLAKLRGQSRTGRISRSVFEKLQDDNQKRINRARSAIERVILDLRGR